ncbi:MAG: pantetheine-phosphate adenylyltransferase, partial [Bacteroidales bacterium]|nr:pantetheine-phosphate adenylyltransferase [Bacteroidales bacterium]
MKNIAVFAGSFSPFTKGHEDIVRKTLPLFEKIYVAIGHNYNKKDVFSVEQRMKWIEQLYSSESKVEVVSYEGLTVDLCAKLGASYLLRGVRGAADCQQEQEMYLVNKQLAPNVETLLVPASPQWM